MNSLDGYVYHMVHFDNLRNIFRRRALLSKEKVLQEKIHHHSIANDGVQGFRDRIYIWDFSRRKFRSLHSYVPFYFATLTPMLHNKYTEGVQDSIVIFEVSRSVLKEEGVLFTDGNASKQRLSDPEKHIREVVRIIPAATSNTSCQRMYRPNGPYGTSLSCSDFYSDVAFLDRLDWDGINNKRHIESLEEYIRVRHAEVLVPDLLPLGRVAGIAVKTREIVQAVNALLEESGLAGRIPSALRKPTLFF